MDSFITNIKLDREKIIQLLLKNGVSKLMKTPTEQSFSSNGIYHTRTSLEMKLKKIEKETGIIIPSNPSFTLFYNIDGGDFDVAYLYDFEFKNYLMIPNPKLKDIINIGKGLSRLIPISLANIYEGERWALPKIQIYQKGKIIKESTPVGKVIYSLELQ